MFFGLLWIVGMARERARVELVHEAATREVFRALSAFEAVYVKEHGEHPKRWSQLRGVIEQRRGYFPDRVWTLIMEESDGWGNKWSIEDTEKEIRIVSMGRNAMRGDADDMVWKSGAF
jgi:hypothetical protein